MATTNLERVGKTLDLLRDGLLPFVVRELTAQYGKYWATEVSKNWQYGLNWSGDSEQPDLDIALLLKLLWEQWNLVFNKTLGHSDRTLISELRDHRNRWAHQNAQNRFSSDDTYRVMDSAERLLSAVSAPQQVEELQRARMELLRLRYDEQVRNERRKSASMIESVASATLRPWREIVVPHQDVASGLYQQAEFAADLWQVHLNEGSVEYRDPVEFFRRTYLTESLRQLLAGALSRLARGAGDPVVQLQTNFGGGKTHSMLALYHLFSGSNGQQLPGIDTLMSEAGLNELPVVRRVVLVGNKISPGNPSHKPDGSVVHTLWGELAWQLGGRDAYERIRLDDERATNPGDALRSLFNDYGPCLVLIDEWVAYARQLHDQSDLPAGSFETQFSFAQALTEAAKLARNCLLVISLPASDTSGSPHTRADDVEVGGQRGREALDRLRNVIGRIESSWRPASAEEGFEIVRRRLFEPLTTPEQFRDRDVVARAFAELYRDQQQEFPAECRDPGYEKRIQAAYPIHPEIFDRLYTDWSTLVKFQRTRGVLRLMAAVIHSLWEKQDRNPLIMPATMPIDEQRVQFELTRYLSDNWVPILEKDVDGPNSLPLQLDRSVPNLGKYAAARRVARTVYLGSAPLSGLANRGLEDRRIKLGSAMPGENVPVFGDALRRLAATATYLYQEGTRYWYATQPTVTKLAEDRAIELLRAQDAIETELAKRLRANLRQAGAFQRIHALPQTSADIPDDSDARLVVLGLAAAYTKDASSPALSAAREIWETRGTAPRMYRNTLVFLAPDSVRIQDLNEALSKYLAWESIARDREELNLTPAQVKQAENQRQAADATVSARLPEIYQWLLVPVQDRPQNPVEWQAIRLTGQDDLAVRAGKKLQNDDLLVPVLAPSILRTTMDAIPLWRGDHVTIRQLVDDFARYPYLPRLIDSGVLLSAIHRGIGMLTWEHDSFAYAERYDEAQGRYQGLQTGTVLPNLLPNDSGILVRSDVARRQLDAERATTPPPAPGRPATPGAAPAPTDGSAALPTEAAPSRPKHFFGVVELEAQRMARDAANIAEEIVSHLLLVRGARVTVTLEIQADLPADVSDHTVRTVTENSRTLRFSDLGFDDL